MLVYHAISDGAVGGAGIFISRLLPALSALGVSSKVLLPKESGLVPILSSQKIPLSFCIKENAPFSLRDTRAILRRIRCDAPRILVSHGSLSAKVAARLCGLPSLTVKHCDLPVKHPILYRCLTTATVATSLPCADHLTSQGIPSVFCIENGFSPVAPTEEETRKAARKALGLDENQMVLGLCGRLSAVKGHETALYALSLLKAEGKKPYLLFLGEGEEKEKLCRLASDLGIGEQVVFLGYSPRPAPFYAALDAHLSCSVASETSSLALAEGMSAGIPTIASDTPGNRLRVGNGGMLYPVGNARALANCLHLLFDPKVREKMKKAALLRANSLPSWEDTAKKYRELFLFLTLGSRKTKETVAF